MARRCEKRNSRLMACRRRWRSSTWIRRRLKSMSTSDPIASVFWRSSSGIGSLVSRATSSSPPQAPRSAVKPTTPTMMWRRIGRKAGESDTAGSAENASGRHHERGRRGESAPSTAKATRWRHPASAAECRHLRSRTHRPFRLRPELDRRHPGRGGRRAGRWGDRGVAGSGGRPRHRVWEGLRRTASGRWPADAPESARPASGPPDGRPSGVDPVGASPSASCR